MPLPSTAGTIPRNAPPMNAQNGAYDIKEAIQTGLKAGMFSIQQGVFSKVPKILGGGVLAERAEFKRRQLFEKEGRDPTTGRKLSKEELAERADRRKSYGTMGDIFDSVQEIERIVKTQFGAKKPVIETPKNVAPTEKTMPYALADENGESTLKTEELSLEERAADKETQEEIQKRNENFFEALFKKYMKPSEVKPEGGGGILGSIGDVVTTAIGGALGGLLGKGGGKLLGGVGKLFKGAVGGASKFLGGAASSASKFLGGAASSASKFLGSATSSAGKFLGGAVGKAASASKGFLGNAFNFVSSGLSKINPLTGLKDGVTKIAPGILKSAAAVPLISTGIQAILSGMEISNIKSNPDLSAEDKKEQIGRAVGSGLGSLLGSIGGGALGTLIPIPVVGTAIGALGGGVVGSYAGDYIAEALGGKGIYEALSGIPLLGDLLAVEETPSIEQAPMDVLGKPLDDRYEGGIVPGQPPSTLEGGIVPGKPPKTFAGGIPVKPTTVPSSAASLSSLQNEASMLKAPQITTPIIAPTTNNVVNQSNSAAVMGSITPSRTGADLGEAMLFRNQFGFA